MTNDEKKQKLLECKANAYDSIVRLRATHDSHRRFHALTLHVIASVTQFANALSHCATTSSPQFPCACHDPQCEACHGECKRDASCQVELTPNLEQQMGVTEMDNVLMCDECANSALHRGTASLLEECCPETGQDFS